MTHPLSPAAQAVITAQAKQRCLFEWSNVSYPPCHPSYANWNGCVQCIDRLGTAAALRAAGEQVLPEMDEPDWGACDYMQCDIELYTNHQRKRAELLAIATELEANS